jgi:hypothetical protein
MARQNATEETARRTHADRIGTDAYDRSGEKIGGTAQVYLDNGTDRPVVRRRVLGCHR